MIALFNVLDYSLNTNGNLPLIIVIFSDPLLLSPFAARCILNMKKAGDMGGNAGTNCVISLSTACFDDNPMLLGSDAYA